MKQFIEQRGNYSIFKVDSKYLYKIAEFVVMANYSHHSNKIYPAELEDVYQIITKPKK